MCAKKSADTRQRTFSKQPICAIPPIPVGLFTSHIPINMETMHRPYRVIKKVKADHLGISGTSGKSVKSGTDEGKEFSDWSLLPDKVFVRIMKHLLTGQWPAAIHHLMSTRVYQTASFSSFGMFVTTMISQKTGQFQQPRVLQG